MNEKKTIDLTGVVVAVDFDGTCVYHDFPEIGEAVPDAIFALKLMVQAGAQLVLYTMRADTDKRKCLTEAIGWFITHDIPLLGVNINPTQREWTTSPKVYANLYIDAAAVGCPLAFDKTRHRRPFVYWRAVLEYLAAYEKHAPSIIPAKAKIVTE
jgi:hypothetical protein